MPKTYTHLTEEQRCQIYESLIEKQSHRAIANRIGKHHGRVSREVARNVVLKAYRPRQAHISAIVRKELKPKYIKLTPKVQAIIRKHIGKEWSPEQIQGRLKLDGTEMVCPATIYRFIKLDKAAGGDLYKHLRHKKPYKNRTGSDGKIGQIIGRISMDDMPSVVDANHEKIKKVLGCDTYFAHPYCSWERGLNENHMA